MMGVLLENGMADFHTAIADVDAGSTRNELLDLILGVLTEGATSGVALLAAVLCRIRFAVLVASPSSGPMVCRRTPDGLGPGHELEFASTRPSRSHSVKIQSKSILRSCRAPGQSFLATRPGAA